MTEIKAYLLDKIEVREKLTKNMKRFNTITRVMGTGLITSTVVTGGVSIAAFAGDVGRLVGIELARISLIFFLATVIPQKSCKIFTIK